jgi:hypothetical protein
MTAGWITDKLDIDIIFNAALYKRRASPVVDGISCELDVICPDNVVVYLATKALKDAPREVKSAGYTLLNLALQSMRIRDAAVERLIEETFAGVERYHYEAKHADEARELMARELRRCVVCRTDAYTLFERFVKCVEISGSSYLFIIRRHKNATIHVVADSTADALSRINKILMAEYRVVVDANIETFEALMKIYAATSC